MRAFWKLSKLATTQRLKPLRNVSLGRKLKMPKRCEKRVDDHIKVVVCKKALPKTPNILKIKAFSKWPKLATTQRLYPSQNGKSGSNYKCQKGAENNCTTTLKLLCAKNRSKKHLIFENLKHFKNGHNWRRFKGYRLCKIVSLGKKLKMPRKVWKTIVRPH